MIYFDRVEVVNILHAAHGKQGWHHSVCFKISIEMVFSTN